MKGVGEKTLWFWRKFNKTSIVRVIVRDYWPEPMFLPSLRKFYIDNSIAKFISLVVQIYLAGLAIANSFEKTASDC